MEIMKNVGKFRYRQKMVEGYLHFFYHALFILPPTCESSVDSDLSNGSEFV
jgi:hypothetical protein